MPPRAVARDLRGVLEAIDQVLSEPVAIQTLALPSFASGRGG
jgi:hypothetical protein